MIRKFKKIIYKLRYILIILSAFLGLLGISGVFGYDIITDCYCDKPSNCNNTKKACIDLDLQETYDIGDYNNTITGGLNFVSNKGPLIFSKDIHFVGSNTYDIYTYTFYQADGYITTLQLNYYNSNKGDTYIYTGSKYCLVEDTTDNLNFYICGHDSTQWNFSRTVEEATGLIENAKLIGWRILPLGNSESSTWLANIRVCGMYDNNTAICIPSLGAYQYSWATNCNNSNLSVCSYSGTIRSKVSPGYSTGEIEPLMLYSGYNYSTSPFLSDSGGGDIVSDTGSITNFEAILGYNYTYGFNESYCYGGYPISDIFNSTDNPENFTGFELGSGAYIYDIYDAYSGSYFTSASQFYQSFYSRYLVNNIASFYNYPKALYGIVERYAWLYDHYQTYDPNVGISKLVSYCELYKLDPDALYTGGDISAENGYSNLIGEITDKRRYYDSGPLSILSGENIKFGSDEFFTNILNKITNSLDNVSNNSVGVIPRYILVVLAALILFRLMSH